MRILGEVVAGQVAVLKVVAGQVAVLTFVPSLLMDCRTIPGTKRGILEISKNSRSFRLDTRDKLEPHDNEAGLHGAQ